MVPYHDLITNKRERKFTSHEHFRRRMKGLQNIYSYVQKRIEKKFAKYGITFATKESKNILGGKLLPAITLSSWKPDPKLLNIIWAQTIINDSSQIIILWLTRTGCLFCLSQPVLLLCLIIVCLYLVEFRAVSCGCHVRLLFCPLHEQTWQKLFLAMSWLWLTLAGFTVD